MSQHPSKAFPKWLTPVLPYLAVGLGLFWFRDAWSALLGFHLAILVSLLLARTRIPIHILFKGDHVSSVILSLLLCGSVGIFLYFFWPGLGVDNDLSLHIRLLGLNSSNWIAFIAYFSLVNPFLEEYYWRGLLGSPTSRPHVSDFLYAGFHGLILLGSLPALSILLSLTVLVLAGWFWRQLAREDHGLLAPVLGHMAADLTILVAIYRMA